MNVRIAKSPIHGRGVFANTLIYKDDWQTVYGDLRVLLPGDIFERYGVEWDEERVFMPYAPWCCCNHSFTPNCVVSDYPEVVGDHLMITALRDIHPNEELLLDYGYDPSDH